MFPEHLSHTTHVGSDVQPEIHNLNYLALKLRPVCEKGAVDVAPSI